MAAAIGLRNDYGSGGLRAAAKRSKDGPQARRLLALAAIYDGATRTEAAKIGGVGLQVVRDWVVKFNAQGPDGLIDRKAPGQPPRLNDVHRAALAGTGHEISEHGTSCTSPGNGVTGVSPGPPQGHPRDVATTLHLGSLARGRLISPARTRSGTFLRGGVSERPKVHHSK